MTNVYIGDIVEIQHKHIRLPTVGKIVSINPIKCQLKCGAIFNVSNCKLKVLRRELSNKFKILFK